MTVEQDKNIPTNTGEQKDETGVGIPEPKKEENAPQLSSEDIKELLAIKKENEQRKLQDEMYGSIGGKAKFEEMTAALAGNVSDEERDSINNLLKSGNLESVKAGVSMVKSIHSRLAPKAPEAAGLPDVPGIGQAAAPIPSNTQQTQDGKKAEPTAEASVSNIIDYNNITKPQVKSALDKINEDLLTFHNEHYGEDYDVTDIAHRKAVDVLDRLVETGIAMKDEQLAKEALLVYNAIAKANIQSGIKNRDPIPGRIWENAGDLVNQRNIQNRLTGKGQLDFFKEEFAVDELEAATIDNLFKQRMFN